MAGPEYRLPSQHPGGPLGSVFDTRGPGFIGVRGYLHAVTQGGNPPGGHSHARPPPPHLQGTRSSAGISETKCPFLVQLVNPPHTSALPAQACTRWPPCTEGRVSAPPHGLCAPGNCVVCLPSSLQHPGSTHADGRCLPWTAPTVLLPQLDGLLALGCDPLSPAQGTSCGRAKGPTWAAVSPPWLGLCGGCSLQSGRGSRAAGSGMGDARCCDFLWWQRWQQLSGFLWCKQEVRLCQNGGLQLCK